MSAKLIDKVRLHPLSGKRVRHDGGLTGIVLAVDGKGYPLILFDKPVFVQACHPQSLAATNRK